MPDGTTQATPLTGAGQQPAPATTGVNTSSSQMDDMTKRLLSRIMQPRTSVQPSPGADQPPAMMAPMGGIARSQDEGRQMFVNNLFALIHNAGAAQKAQQLKHATGVLHSLNNSWQDAQELYPDDKKKAMEHFSSMPSVTHVLEDKKNVKQLGKLLQFDFMDPEKKKTVWHEALGNVVEAGKQLPFIKQLTEMMSKHKENQAAKSEQPTDYAKREQEASATAKQFAGQAQQDPAQQAEMAKLLPSLVASQGANVREREKELHAERMQGLKQDFMKDIQAIKDPVDKAIARGMALQSEGNLTEAQKNFDMAHKGASAKSTKAPSMSMPALVDRSLHDPDPAERKKADETVKALWGEQEKQLQMRGTAFGMGRPMQFTDDNGVFGEAGSPVVLNGLQMQQAAKGGNHFTLIGPLNPQTMLATQQVVRQYQPVLGKLSEDLDAYDNAKDRAIISRVMRANPEAKAMDESTLGIFLDQNLKGQLSPKGQALTQDIATAAEVLGRIRTLNGQTSTGMNTQLILSLLPGEDTPNKAYGQKKIENLYNLINGLVQAPLLGGARNVGKAKAKGASAPAAGSGEVVIDLTKKPGS